MYFLLLCFKRHIPLTRYFVGHIAPHRIPAKRLRGLFYSKRFSANHHPQASLRLPKMPNRYSHTYIDIQGPGDARPTALQIIKDEDLEGKFSDKVVLITGCSSGIGVETARAMAATGARCFLTARNLKKAEGALSGILEPGRVELLEMDQNSLDSVRKAAKEFLSRSDNKLNILIANAGIMALPTLTKTADDYEAQFGTNHLSHFLLFNLVKDAMVSSSKPGSASRVVMVSSSGHRACPVQLGNYNFSDPNGTPYSPFIGYGNSKTANIWMANYIDREYGPKGITALSLHPGGIWTGLQDFISEEQMAKWRSIPGVEKLLKSTEQGAATSVYAAVGKEWEGNGGKFLEDCDLSPLIKEGETAPNGRAGYVPHAFNPEGENRLWVDSLKMAGL